jgi:hypothetical protein
MRILAIHRGSGNRAYELTWLFFFTHSALESIDSLG